SVSGASDDIERTLSALPRFVEAVGSDRYRFVDAMVQEVAYDRIPFKTRRSLHDGITDVLLAMPPDDGLVDQLAFHSYRAQRWSEAYEYATGAAERAETAYANVDAINLYEQALDAARHLTDPSDQTAEMWETVGDLHKRIGRSDRADVAYRKARRSRDDPLGLARLMHKHADLRRILGRYPEALRWLTRGLKEMEGLRDVGACAVRSELEAKYGAIRQTQGRPRDAIRWCERALESACPSGAVAAEALATKILDAALTTLGEGSEHALAYRALDLYEQANDLDGQARMMNNLGSYAFWRGDWPEAVRLWDQSSEILNRIGNAAMASLGSGNVAEVLADQGHLEEAEARFRDVRRIWNAAGVRRGEAFADLHLARIAARSGRLDEAADLFDAARDEFADIGASVEAAETDLRRAEGLLFAGKAHEAHGVLAESGLLPVPDDLPPPLIPVAHRVIGFGYLQNGDLGRARTSFHTAMEAARGQGARYEEALILAGQMRLALIAGDEFEALAEEHQRLVTELEVIALPAIPGPTG
ncbi:MAG: tetratricopeptide repeat protein, partial [Actinomycetota bacterium]